MGEKVILLGEEVQSGAYVLRLSVARPLALPFGRFKGGAPIEVPAGEALYIGSAMAQRGSTALARRLLRHASRSAGGAPQPLRSEMLACFRAAGLGPPDVAPPAGKRPSWHIDYLLDQPAVTLAQVFVVRSRVPLEQQIAAALAADPATSDIAPGLGAQDRRGQTHLLAVQAAQAWWDTLPQRLDALRAAANS